MQLPSNILWISTLLLVSLVTESRGFLPPVQVPARRHQRPSQLSLLPLGGAITSQPSLSTPLRSSSLDNNNDSRSVGWTVANLFWVNDSLLVFYHAAGVAWDNLVPLGAAAGLLAHVTGLYQPFPVALQSTGMAAYYTGLSVMALGVVKQFSLDNPNDISVFANELRNDYDKRVMDQSVWIGCGVAGAVLITAGGPVSVGLASGTTGVLQGLCLGSVGGSCLGWYQQRG